MAPNKITLFLLISLATFTYSKVTLELLKETEMTLYFQDYTGKVKPTVIELPSMSTGPFNFTKFGAIFCTDYPITEEMEESSTPIARGQGIYVTSALDGSRAHVLTSIIFINSYYNGSSLAIQGSSPQFQRVREVAVVGGTGKFRLARGYATFETVYYDSEIHYAVLRCNLTVLHY